MSSLYCEVPESRRGFKKRFILKCIYERKCVCVCEYVHACVCVYVCACMCVCVCVCACVLRLCIWVPKESRREGIIATGIKWYELLDVGPGKLTLVFLRDSVCS